MLLQNLAAINAQLKKILERKSNVDKTESRFVEPIKPIASLNARLTASQWLIGGIIIILVTIACGLGNVGSSGLAI